jgi:L-ascorbate metabolism protein UlaG (beta-lactamase superfamily)
MADEVPQPLPTYNRSHHSGGKFVNTPGEPCLGVNRSEHSFFGQLLRRLRSESDSYPPYPVTRPDFSGSPAIRSYWIGHATNLIEISGFWIITDPVFEDHASPISGLVKRITPAASQIEDLPPISVILISHDHWDHLESSAIEKIHRQSPQVKIFAPLVVADLIRGWGYDAISFDWRHHLVYESIDFTCFPARHQAARYGLDSNERLWCSWLVTTPDISIYFAGDTAIGPQFAEVRAHVGRPIDLAMLPVAPQEPSDWMRVMHMGPQDAFDMSRALEARAMYPIHYGSFTFGPKPEFPAPIKIRMVWEGDGLHVLGVGEHLVWNGTLFVPPGDPAPETAPE